MNFNPSPNLWISSVRGSAVDVGREAAGAHPEDRANPVSIPVVRGLRMRAAVHHDCEMVDIDRADDEAGCPVDEEVGAAVIGLDESEALLAVEPLHDAPCGADNSLQLPGRRPQAERPGSNLLLPTSGSGTLEPAVGVDNGYMGYRMLRPNPMEAKVFERFTDQARRTVVLASEAARAHNHDHLGTEHILLGLIRERDGAAARSLEAFGVSAAVLGGRPRRPTHHRSRRASPIRAHPVHPARQADPRTEHARNFAARPRAHRHRTDPPRPHRRRPRIHRRTVARRRPTGGLRPTASAHSPASHRAPPHAELGLGPTHVTTVRLTDAEHALCVAAAAKAGQPIDTWMRDRILDAARASGASPE